jgi:raffinose/stachyose/melibiose transport system substrate-binding protein
MLTLSAKLKSSCMAAIAVAAVAVTPVKAEDITLWTLNFDNNAANVALKKVASDFEAANP